VEPTVYRSHGDRPLVDARTVWTGGLATALVAGLVALAGVLLAKGLLDTPVLVVTPAQVVRSVTPVNYAGIAAAGALLATGVLHVLLRNAPAPLSFFGWIVALVTVITMAWPFLTDAPVISKIVTAVVNLFIGVSIGSLLAGVGARACRSRRPTLVYDRNGLPPT
jgi:hypothetical protein